MQISAMQLVDWIYYSVCVK